MEYNRAMQQHANSNIHSHFFFLSSNILHYIIVQFAFEFKLKLKRCVFGLEMLLVAFDVYGLILCVMWIVDCWLLFSEFWSVIGLVQQIAEIPLY